MPRRKPLSPEIVRRLVDYVRSWAETTTEEECSIDPRISIPTVDLNILRARKLLKKYKIPFTDPSED